MGCDSWTVDLGLGGGKKSLQSGENRHVKEEEDDEEEEDDDDDDE